MCNKAAPKSIVEMGKKGFALVFLLPILDVVLCKEGGCQTILPPRRMLSSSTVSSWHRLFCVRVFKHVKSVI